MLARAAVACVVGAVGATVLATVLAAAPEPVSGSAAVLLIAGITIPRPD